MWKKCPVCAQDVCLPEQCFDGQVMVCPHKQCRASLHVQVIFILNGPDEVFLLRRPS